MKILIVAATWMEVNLLVEDFEKVEEKSHLLKTYRFKESVIDILITGIGTIFSTFHLTNALRDERYDLVLNVGIAGSLTRELKIGEVVNVVYDEFADLGVETPTEFLTVFESGYVEINEYPFENGVLKASYAVHCEKMKKVRGITANKTHGRASSIETIYTKFSAHTESMEGAAVFYVCNWMGVDCCQVRAISNFVEPRDPSKWDIPLALENLRKAIRKVLTNSSVAVE
eukprot:Anaeramoba_ignava/a98780_10.p1 GENE.a98780_10~~a98780_10.p1  ORF type:complete len:229 (-),score=-6.85 a98780_10:7-693(-)